ncbi:MAG: lycopene cyclase domain-containing protein [Chloroflexota bacterium]
MVAIWEQDFVGMSYFGFLALFVGIPLLIAAILNWQDVRNGKPMPGPLTSWGPYPVIGWLVVVAVVYTTPWDNYLVATRVWWYDPDLVTGIVFGWVPIEEYTFFVVQTLMTGLWTTWLLRRMPYGDLPKPDQSRRIRFIATGIAGVIWLISVILLVLSFTGGVWRQFTYLALEVSWAFIPIMLQLIVGADILWRHRYAVGIAILSTWLYLSGADALAIESGTWTINPEQSLPILIGGILPIEEAIFFLLTNVLVVFGLTLVIEHASEERIPVGIRSWLHRRKPEDRKLVPGAGD